MEGGRSVEELIKMRKMVKMMMKKMRVLISHES